MRLLFLRSAEDSENAAAWEWARSRADWQVAEAASDHVTAATALGAQVIWCHAGDKEPGWTQGSNDALRQALDKGATVVLSLLAAPLGLALGGSPHRPHLEAARVWSHEKDPRWPHGFRDWPHYPHIRGFMGWGAHPLFWGMGQGTFTWVAREGDVTSRAVFTRPNWPAARVIAVDRSYVHVDADTAVAWELEVGKGRVICLGANLHFCTGEHLLRAQRDALLVNALSPPVGVVARNAVTPGSVARPGWPGAVRRHASVSVVPRPRAISPLHESGGVTPRWHGEDSGNRDVTLGSPWGMIAGTQSHGLTEVWLTSMCILGGGVSVNVEGNELTPSVTSTSAGHFERNLIASSGQVWREFSALSPERSELAYALDPVSSGKTGESVGMEFRVPLRLQWPYPADALVPLRTEIRRDGDRATVLVTGRDGQHVVAFFLDGAAAVTVREDEAAPVVQAMSNPGAGIRMVARATDQGGHGLGNMTTSVQEFMDAQGSRVGELQRRALRMSSGLGALDAAFAWAQLRLSNFMGMSSSGAKGLRAGFAASRPGWNASRPGYAWFFGRDTCWSVDALLCAGMFEEARAAIDLLAQTADVTGKIIHEHTVSGASHYDAADSTPLFLRAVATYAEWTADVEGLRTWWPAVTRAFDFVLACDRDGDGLPENTGVGHGWIEMGPLGGGVVTSYVAAIWIDALRRLAPVAEFMDDRALAARVRGARVRAEGSLDSLRLPGGRLALHRDASGRLFQELTALAAVPIALGVEPSSSVGEVLAELATSRFSAPWGLRLLPNDDHRYDPAGYHTGSVWPLFTGWAALADCAVGNLEGGLARVMAIAVGATAGGTGGFAEVLHGDTGARAGVCRDQAWSAAMAITPVVTGLAGIVPDALNGRCLFGVQLPTGLHDLDLSGLRVGAARVDCRWRRQGRDVILTVSHVSGPPLGIATQRGSPWQLVGESTPYTAHSAVTRGGP